MAYDIPTYAEFIARFPIFSNATAYPQTVVQSIIVEASNQIDSSWREVDYKPAILFLAAHKLATDNSGADDAVDIGGPTSIASESFAGMSISYKKQDANAGSAAASSYGLTSYGRRYYELLIKNRPSVVVA